MSALVRLGLEVRALFRPEPGSTGWARAARPLAALYVVVQLALPAAYYLRRDPHDERFSWRMFSPMRMTTCQPVARVEGRPVALAENFHEAWIELARRGRRSVLDEMGRALCRKHPGAAVTLEVSCEYQGGATVKQVLSPCARQGR